MLKTVNRGTSTIKRNKNVFFQFMKKWIILLYILFAFAHEVVRAPTFNVWEAWIGRKRNDSISDATTKAERAIGTSLITSPMVPLIMSAGIKEKRVVMEAIVTGSAISFAPIIAAVLGSIPSSICCWIFSLTTMASSTTIPIASSTPTREIIFIVKPEK